MTVGAGIAVQDGSLLALGAKVLREVRPNVLVTPAVGGGLTNGAFLGVRSAPAGSRSVFPVGKLRLRQSSPVLNAWCFTSLADKSVAEDPASFNTRTDALPSETVTTPHTNKRSHTQVEETTADVEWKLEGNGSWNIGTDFELIHTPGHTPGSVCLYYKPLKVLFTGDHVAQAEESDDLNLFLMYSKQSGRSVDPFLIVAALASICVLFFVP